MFGHSKKNKTSKSKPKTKLTPKTKAKTTAKPKVKLPTSKPSKSTAKPKAKPTTKPTSKLAISQPKAILTTKPKEKPTSKLTISKSKMKTQSKLTVSVQQPKVPSKNVSNLFKKISGIMKGKNNIGMTLKTDDKFLSKDKNTKSKSRWVAVIDKNSKDEFAVVNLTSEKKPYSSELKGYSAGNNKTTYFKHFVEIEDDESQPIKVNSKFVPNLSNYDLNQTQVLQINKKLFTEVKNKNKNEAKITKLKNR